MHRSTLLCASLSAVFVIAVSTFPGLLIHDSAHAAPIETRVQTQGSLQVLNDKGKPVSDCPLKHTAVKAEVSGFISRVTVTQDFENPFPEKIEAVYIFPLPQAAAVDDLTMLIGERTIRGKIMRREEAQKAYAAAKQLGQIASLLDQERPNIFVQQVANILPGQTIRIVISYVETLKYEDGFYEWSFPMVVAPRYISADPAVAEIIDAARISPPSPPEGMRAGHDISLELDLNTGIPILEVNSETHETEVQLLKESRARVQLKDRATIPNKDFVLKYRVAGSSIKDAVLTHRSERGGFFTLILQPPQRVAPEDVMPKEVVFVIDTSGSMSGFPIEKAKQTAQLALDTLYPHDTFNLITFSGNTRILFSEPVPATHDNLHEAKKFLSNLEGGGGTEMMKAIKAALKPSDSQHHVRIVCFMTDGQVGMDMEILGEVQKYRNARVFAMGFGSSPNRYLLDKMAEYGRGEVDYVLDQGDTSSVARRFNERIRNPLLTDISIDWSGLPITDVYPRQAPDLFSAKPLIFSGRYESGAQGKIRLKGKMADQDFVREIPIELPETQAEHDVLATLWARRKIDDLMGEEMKNLTDASVRDQKREEIAELGLRFKLMTQYTSLIAIDDVTFTGIDESKRVHVPVEIGQVATMGPSGLVTVTASSQTVQCSVGSLTQDAVSTAKALPLQGRSFDRLISLTPGTAIERSGSPIQPSQTDISINRQNTSFTIDGASANFAIAPGGESPGPTASGNALALTASGGANGLATLDAIQEVEIQTSSVKAEHGRTTGGQVIVTTRVATNNFHGSGFHFFGNDSFDASDWFANSRGLPKPPKSLNFFGGTFSGPIYRDHTFFFGSYEGMRLRQPVVGITDVPSLFSRSAAPSSLQPFLDAFPVPNGPTRPDGLAEFAASSSNPAAHDVGSIRIDQVTPYLNLKARYNFANSDAEQRGAERLSLANVNRIRSHAQVITGSMAYTASPSMLVELSGNYSRLRVDGSYLLDQFGGAAVPTFAIDHGSFGFDLNSRSAGWMIGDKAASVQRQFHLTGLVSKVAGNHLFKFGGDYRRLSPTIGVRTSQQSVLFDGVSQVVNGVAGRFTNLNHPGPQRPVFESFSLFAQDEWRVRPRFTFNYGMRWEVAPAPATENNTALAVDQVSVPATLSAVPDNALWQTSFANLGPRASVAYHLSQSTPEVVLRGGIGVMYDVGHGRAGNLFANSLPFVSGSSVFNAPLPIVSTGAATSQSLPFIAFDPQLELPYTINWNISIETSFGWKERLTAAYVGSTGRRLLHTETLFNQNPDFSFLRLTTNRGRSDYRALQLMFHRTWPEGLAAMVGYTWSQSLDNVTHDSERSVVMTSFNPDLDRGPSDFHARHSLTGSVSYTLPALMSNGLGNKLSRNWTINSIFNSRSARPLNVVYMFPTSFGVAFLRPDRVNDAPVYVLDPAAPGDRRLNADAFHAPAGLQQGTLSRNSLRGFPLYQVDFGLQRRFYFAEGLVLEIGADAFNVFNHANFEDPLGNDLVIGSRFGAADSLTPNLAFGESTSMSGRNLSGGGFASFYGPGGARTMRFSVKLMF